MKITTPEGYVIEADTPEEMSAVARVVRDLTTPVEIRVDETPREEIDGGTADYVLIDEAQVVTEEPQRNWHELAYPLTPTTRKTLVALVHADRPSGVTAEDMVPLLTKANRRYNGIPLGATAVGSRLGQLVAKGLAYRLSRGVYRATEEARQAYLK